MHVHGKVSRFYVLTTDVQFERIREMRYRIDFSEEKNLLLKETRGIEFEDVIDAIAKGNIIDDFQNKKAHPNQRILAVRMRQYVYAVPYILDKKKGVVFLKTVYPSRVLTKKYSKTQNI